MAVIRNIWAHAKASTLSFFDRLLLTPYSRAFLKYAKTNNPEKNIFPSEKTVQTLEKHFSARHFRWHLHQPEFRANHLLIEAINLAKDSNPELAAGWSERAAWLNFDKPGCRKSFMEAAEFYVAALKKIEEGEKLENIDEISEAKKFEYAKKAVECCIKASEVSHKPGKSISALQRAVEIISPLAKSHPDFSALFEYIQMQAENSAGKFSSGKDALPIYLAQGIVDLKNFSKSLKKLKRTLKGKTKKPKINEEKPALGERA